MALMNKKTQDEFKEKQVKPPNTWQYHCLMFQEGLVATALVCGIVFFELIYIILVARFLNAPPPNEI